MKQNLLSTAQASRKEARRLREIRKWEKEKARPRTNLYLAYLVFIITLIYTTDEIASQIGMLMKTEIANDLFARFGAGSVSALELLGMLGLPFQIIGLLYRPLADKLGRKLFLIINTFGMSIALLTIYLSQNVALYFIGACLVQFFIPHDMHVVYIMETTPPKHRARIYSSVKFVATLGIMLVPLLRRFLMQDTSQWRNVYLIPALVGLATSFLALLTAKETDAFLDARLAYLKEEPSADASPDRTNANPTAQGGLFAALKFAMKHCQLRWLYITAALANIGFLGTINYQVILSYGFADGFYGSFTEEIMNLVSLGPVTQALFLFPTGCAFSQLIMGFISDSKGRKAAALTVTANCLAAFLGFTLGASFGLSPYLVGFLCGACIGSYYSLNDIIIMMVGESAPTSLRSSAMSAQFIVTAAGVILSYGIGLPLVAVFGNQAMGTVSFALLVPGFVLALLALAGKTGDTRGINLDTVTGCEWD